MVKKIVRAAMRKVKRQRVVQKKKKARLLHRDAGQRITSAEQADAILDALCVDKMVVTPDEEWEDVPSEDGDKAAAKEEGDLKCTVLKSLRGKKKQLFSKGARRRKEQGIAVGTAAKERLLAKLANSKQKRKARLAFLQEDD
eukprot:GGOE01046942.1.p3 GENE.GGOE01046942.1~~GGOE01046942.1.p3  ORF type:complete len:142 (-),score=62.72 GGOE01046942.1:189-614(-)